MPNCWLWGGQNSRKLSTSTRRSFFSSSPKFSTWFCRSSMETRQPSDSPLPSLSIFHMMRAANLARREPRAPCTSRASYVLLQNKDRERRDTKIYFRGGNRTDPASSGWWLASSRSFEGKEGVGFFSGVSVLIWRSVTGPISLGIPVIFLPGRESKSVYPGGKLGTSPAPLSLSWIFPTS